MKVHIGSIIMSQSDLDKAILKAKKLVRYLKDNDIEILDDLKIISEASDDFCCVGVMYRCEKPVKRSTWDV